MNREQTRNSQQQNKHLRVQETSNGKKVLKRNSQQKEERTENE